MADGAVVTDLAGYALSVAASRRAIIAGGLVYRTHALEYVYVRRNRGHTFVAGVDELLAHGERTYPGLPVEIIYPDRVAVPASRPG